MAAGCPNVIFLPLQPDNRFPQLLRTADIHVIPQRAEAADLVLPSKLGGMLASGRPVVAMAPPGPGLAQEVNEAGLVIPPGDADALASAVLSLSHDQALRQKLGAQARRRALAHWDKDAILGALDRELLAFCGQGEQSGALEGSPARVSSA
jgi:colanic acid biosynthesis glycosyl transferase WcaI